MRPYVFIILTIISFKSIHYAYCDIKNGYEFEIKLADQCLRNIDSLMEICTDDDQMVKLKMHRKRIEYKRKEYQKKYLITHRILKKFKDIAPEIYYTVDRIRDYEKNVTDIFVKIVDKSEFNQEGILATTNLAQSEKSEHRYHSEYCDGSVSVKVSNLNEWKTLEMLAHEFGHVLYQVPNLASYLDYYYKAYLKYKHSISKGHGRYDPSHQSVINTLADYSDSMRNYLSTNKKGVESAYCEIAIPAHIQ